MSLLLKSFTATDNCYAPTGAMSMFGTRVRVKPNGSQPKSVGTKHQKYALGFANNKSSENYKILRVLHYDETLEMEIYEFNSGSWRVLDSDNQDFKIHQCGISLKGNTYWLASNNEDDEEDLTKYFLISFDFTTERFGTLGHISAFRLMVILSIHCRYLL
ncbi:unnamed protein product [Microthlaspi erraticum]|uniref:F-box associated beta-propeller type 1 domain-containing protein n=1 Tax=Microthlaspi erraticum TaxID=1685480 RepID=A0A6D2KA67_9BRAS|nr:unnamed protein product [Microthlaspi erraticum]